MLACLLASFTVRPARRDQGAAREHEGRGADGRLPLSAPADHGVHRDAAGRLCGAARARRHCMSARLRDRITRAGDSGSVYLDTGALWSSEIVSFVFFVFYIFSSPPCCTPFIIYIHYHFCFFDGEERDRHPSSGAPSTPRPADSVIDWMKCHDASGAGADAASGVAACAWAFSAATSLTAAS